VPHGFISTFILAELLSRPANWAVVPADFARRVAVAVGGHHGTFPRTEQWDLVDRLMGNDRWWQARRSLLAQLAAELGVAKLPPPADPGSREHAFFMFLAGLTSVADWIGSNKQQFPSATGQVDLPAYLNAVPRRADQSLGVIGWSGWKAENSGPSRFSELFPHIREPRPLQVEAERQAQSLVGPALVLMEAPMGEGKTEAALFVADHCIHALGRQGLYVALPTQATSNQMFERVTRFLGGRYPKERINAHLLHGQAFLSDLYGRMRIEAVYDDASPGSVVAESWFAQNKKQGLLAPFAVGTVDQALLAALQTKHVFVRLFGLAGKVVILDEVHAYDAYMSTLLERLLEWLSALGCSVILLSATLPASKRARLLSAFAGQAVETPVCPYPRVTVVQPARPPCAAHVPASPERRATISLRWAQPGQLSGQLLTALSAGGCAAVICNTVGSAQATFAALRDALSPQGVEVELFHARFPFGQRQAIEEHVLLRYGAQGDSRPSRAVLVATQVIEQSLDLDFDLMASELAPADLVLQRAGRLHRHRRGHRPAGLRSPQLWLLLPELEGEIPRFGSSEFVYDRHVLLRSYLALRERAEVCLPDDIETLVESVYGEPPPAVVGEPWQSVLGQSQQALVHKKEDHRLAALCFAIRSPASADDILENFCRELEEDNPEVHRTAQALTRLAEPSVTVVFLYRLQGGHYLNPNGKEPVDLHRKPNRDEAIAFLRSAVKLTHPAAVHHFAAQEPPAAWKENGLLRFHRVAELDATGQVAVGRYTLLLDPQLGVVVRKFQE
jgi:CRISPR-associated endonuclease/helicase Cas3